MSLSLGVNIDYFLHTKKTSPYEVPINLHPQKIETLFRNQQYLAIISLHEKNS